MRLLGRAVLTGMLTVAALVVATSLAAVAQSQTIFFDVSGIPSGRGGRGPAASPLTPPNGARVTPGRRHGTNTSFESDARLETQLIPSAVAAHYTSQMEAAHWRVAGRLTDSP